MNIHRVFGVLLLVALCGMEIEAQVNDTKPAVPVPVFEFRVRSAFALTPSMVDAIQVTKRDTGSAARNDPAAPAWGDPTLKTVQLAAPFGIRIQGDRLIALIILTPLELVQRELMLLVQNQIWSKSTDDSIQMNTSFHTVRVPLGMLFYYYPLGVDPKRGAPVALELLIQQK